jgi:hypothetical protein
VFARGPAHRFRASSLLRIVAGTTAIITTLSDRAATLPSGPARFRPTPKPHYLGGTVRAAASTEATLKRETSA